MRRAASIFLALAMTCQLYLLVLGGGPVVTSASPWQLTPCEDTAAAAVATGEGSLWAATALFPVKTNAPLPSLDPGYPAALSRPPKQERPEVRGIYATAYSVGWKSRFKQLISFIGATEINAMVIDVKDDTGTLSYQSEVAMATAIESCRNKFNPHEVMAVLRREDIYPIARIVAFKDPYLAAKRPDLAVRSKSGGIWRDHKGQSWVDPYNREVWRYLVEVAKEAAGLGFKEIQFDYVRFTSDGNLSDCMYPYADGRNKAELIRDFLLFARRELRSTGAEVSADVFGLTCSAQGDLGIGQQIEMIGEAVDIISPMVYPSHYYSGSYNIPDPDAAPYETVVASLRAAVARLDGKEVRLRPWLQDFTLRHKYGRRELMAQIKAVYDAGLTEWIFWNPGNVYNPANYNPK